MDIYIITYNEMFDKMEKIKYNRKSDRDGQLRACIERSGMRKVRAPQGKNNG